jgi:D-apionate oxidoisomerase
MTQIALFGAGGKMGLRLSRNLRDSRFHVRHVEVGEPGRQRLEATLGIQCVSAEQALAEAQIVILAVPDTLVGKVATQIEPRLRPGVMVIALDAAAPFAGHLPKRDDLIYFVTHPCHPPIFNDETDPSARKDHFGGIAKQAIVSALMQGPEGAYALGEEIAKVIWAPVKRCHRVSVEQMALLEPGLSETVCATLLTIIREAMDNVVSRGVPHDAARDFLLGHLNVEAAVIFNESDGVFSDAANKAIQFGKGALMRPDWKRVFEPEEIAASVRRIT